MIFISNSLSETMTLGRLFGRALQGGAVILTEGELGAGKTAFAKGVAKGLGVKDLVNSPTFNIIKVYRAKGELLFYHVDAYRLEDPTTVREIGLDEIIGDPKGVSLIEWGEFIDDYLKPIKKEVYRVEITYQGAKKRQIRIEKMR